MHLFAAISSVTNWRGSHTNSRGPPVNLFVSVQRCSVGTGYRLHALRIISGLRVGVGRPIAPSPVCPGDGRDGHRGCSARYICPVPRLGDGIREWEWPGYSRRDVWLARPVSGRHPAPINSNTAAASGPGQYLAISAAVVPPPLGPPTALPLPSWLPERVTATDPKWRTLHGFN